MTQASGSAPPPISVSFLLIALGRRARERVESRTGAVGVAYHHLSALGHLNRQPGLSYSELARRARVTVQSMQSTVAHLDELGLVDRGTQGQGRRAQLRLTEQGVIALGAAQEAVESADEMFLGSLTTAERETFEDVLLRLFTAATQAGPDVVDPD